MQMVAPEIKLDPGPLQEIFDERSAQAEDERRSDGRLPAGRDQSGGRLPADAAAVADSVGVSTAMLNGAIELRHAPWFWLDPRSFGEGSLLHSADRYGDHHVPDDENDADAGTVDPRSRK